MTREEARRRADALLDEASMLLFGKKYNELDTDKQGAALCEALSRFPAKLLERADQANK